jgi:hypothetical protein
MDEIEINAELEMFRSRGIILGYGGPVGGPFCAQRGPRAIGGPDHLWRSTQGALALAVAAWWE